MYRKLKADQVFNGQEILPGCPVLVTGNEGVIVDILDKDDAGDGIETFTGMLSPGFINCHCHLELSHMKGLIPKHTDLVDFVFKVVSERHFSEEEILAAIEKAEVEMLQNGIVAVGDICNNTFTITQKKKQHLGYHNFIEAMGFIPATAAQRFEHSVGLYNSFAAIFDQNSIIPHAPYSVSPEMFSMINEFPNNKILTIHNQEIAAENELFEKSTGDLLRMYEKMNIDISFFKASGKTSLQTYLPSFTKGQSIILVHNVATTAADIRSTIDDRQLKIFFCLCPNANLYISNKLPDVNSLIDHGCNIVLGTDSLASNDQLSILEEIKTLKHNFPALDIATLFKWATYNGALALGIDNMYGSFEKGKKPGIVLIDETLTNVKRIV